MVGSNGKVINGYTLDFDIAFGINNTQISNQLMILGDGINKFRLISLNIRFFRTRAFFFWNNSCHQRFDS